MLPVGSRRRFGRLPWRDARSELLHGWGWLKDGDDDDDDDDGGRSGNGGDVSDSGDSYSDDDRVTLVVIMTMLNFVNAHEQLSLGPGFQRRPATVRILDPVDGPHQTPATALQQRRRQHERLGEVGRDETESETEESRQPWANGSQEEEALDCHSQKGHSQSWFQFLSSFLSSLICLHSIALICKNACSLECLSNLVEHSCSMLYCARRMHWMRCRWRRDLNSILGAWREFLEWFSSFSFSPIHSLIFSQTPDRCTSTSQSWGRRTWPAWGKSPGSARGSAGKWPWPLRSRARRLAWRPDDWQRKCRPTGRGSRRLRRNTGRRQRRKPSSRRRWTWRWRRWAWLIDWTTLSIECLIWLNLLVDWFD